MRAIFSFLFLCCVSSAQVNEPDRLMQAFTDRAMADQVARMATDERIKMYETLANYKPGDFHYQSLLAGSFIQNVRNPGQLQAGRFPLSKPAGRQLHSKDARDHGPRLSGPRLEDCRDRKSV